MGAITPIRNRDGATPALVGRWGASVSCDEEVRMYDAHHQRGVGYLRHQPKDSRHRPHVPVLHLNWKPKATQSIDGIEPDPAYPSTLNTSQPHPRWREQRGVKLLWLETAGTGDADLKDCERLISMAFKRQATRAEEQKRKDRG